jgi:hypothetical protein
MGAPGEYPFDVRLGTFAKQQTFSTTIIRDGGSFHLPPTRLDLILDVAIAHGEVANQNDTGARPAFYTLNTQTGVTNHEMWIDSFEVSCNGDDCAVEFLAHEYDEI